MPEKVIAYIDGFNLFYSMRQKRWNRFYWLNIKELVQKLLKPNQQLAHTKYFTTMIRSTVRDPGKDRRQSAYIDALGTLTEFEIIKGHYLSKKVTCRSWGASWEMFEEKMTAVNIATELIFDAYRGNFDTALVISADSDLSRAVRGLRSEFPLKRVVMAFPPARSSNNLKATASAWFPIGRVNLASSQFPMRVLTGNGVYVTRPNEWV